MTARNKNLSTIIKKTFLFLMVFTLLAFSIYQFAKHKGYTIDDILYGKNELSAKEDEIAVHIIDVGQGDSILIETSGKFMLIDCGIDDCKNELRAYLNKAGVREIEYFVLSHSHEDHIGNALMILKEFDVNNIVYVDYDYSEKLIDEFIYEKANIIKPEINDKFSMGKSEFTVLSAGGDYDTNKNNYSIVLKMEYEDTSFIFTGDAEIEVEKDILKNFTESELDVDFLKSGHHGSNTSSCFDFVEKLSPDIAVISCGKGNVYGHPDSEVIETYEKLNVKYFRTDIEGTILFVSDGEKIVRRKVA